MLFPIIIISYTPQLLKPWHDNCNILEDTYPLLSVFWGLMLIHIPYTLEYICILLVWILSRTEKEA